MAELERALQRRRRGIRDADIYEACTPDRSSPGRDTSLVSFASVSDKQSPAYRSSPSWTSYPKLHSWKGASTTKRQAPHHSPWAFTPAPSGSPSVSSRSSPCGSPRFTDIDARRDISFGTGSRVSHIIKGFESGTILERVDAEEESPQHFRNSSGKSNLACRFNEIPTPSRSTPARSLLVSPPRRDGSPLEKTRDGWCGTSISFWPPVWQTAAKVEPRPQATFGSHFHELFLQTRACFEREEASPHKEHRSQVFFVPRLHGGRRPLSFPTN